MYIVNLLLLIMYIGYFSFGHNFCIYFKTSLVIKHKLKSGYAQYMQPAVRVSVYGYASPN